MGGKGDNVRIELDEGVGMGLGGKGNRHTVSRLTDAASLYSKHAVVSVQSNRKDGKQMDGFGLPAVVVITVDVEDLLALDTEHTVMRPVMSVPTLLVAQTL